MEKPSGSNSWTPFPAIPISTVLTAKAIYSPDCFYLAIGEQINALFSAQDWEDLTTFARLEFKPAERLAQMVLITLFQFIEDIPDQSVTEATATRIDWKYALHLPIDYPGIPAIALTDFRKRMQSHPGGSRVLERVVEQIKNLELPEKTILRTVDAATILATVHTHSQLRLALETMRLAIEALVIDASAWLQSIAPSYWYARYHRAPHGYPMPRSLGERENLLRAILTDGTLLLTAIKQPDAPARVKEMQEIQNLERVWHEQFEIPHDHSQAIHPHSTGEGNTATPNAS